MSVPCKHQTGAGYGAAWPMRGREEAHPTDPAKQFYVVTCALCGEERFKIEETIIRIPARLTRMATP